MSSRDTVREDGTIILLKKELETTLGSLFGVKTELNRLHPEKEVVLLSEKQSQSIEVLVPQVLTLQSVDNFEKQIGAAMMRHNHEPHSGNFLSENHFLLENHTVLMKSKEHLNSSGRLSCAKSEKENLSCPATSFINAVIHVASGILVLDEVAPVDSTDFSEDGVNSDFCSAALRERALDKDKATLKERQGRHTYLG
ncbi:hypothetical protein L6452_22271 [Arctium lappa]|uniref:Uncharacterized protein n=1 Tax=Arctium lappa TaxID=4217 RepID=A0ACB9AYX7_ARCLA|nr:hypothetical protein L6452_22271 [Arctium lappa]